MIARQRHRIVVFFRQKEREGKNTLLNIVPQDRKRPSSPFLFFRRETERRRPIGRPVRESQASRNARRAERRSILRASETLSRRQTEERRRSGRSARTCDKIKLRQIDGQRARRHPDFADEDRWSGRLQRKKNRDYEQGQEREVSLSSGIILGELTSETKAKGNGW